MNSKHRKTLLALFENPVRSDIEWKRVEQLFKACGGSVTENAGSRVCVRLNGRRAVFHRPHPERETDKGAVKSVRDFLTVAGVEPR